MPATLYNLVNRQHPSIPTTPPEEPAVPEAKVEDAVEIAAIPVSESSSSFETVEESSAPASVEEVSAPELTVSYPSWDAAWSKSQLLAVAQSLNLQVTSISTKAEIISALTIATKS